MARRRLDEAIRVSRVLSNSAVNEENAGQDFTQLCIQQHVSLSKDIHSVYSVSFSPDAPDLAVGFGNGAVQIVDAKSGSMTCELFPGHRTHLPVTALNYHPCKSQILMTVGADGIVTVYNLVSKNAVHHVTEEKNEINALDFCLDGSVFATAGKDRNIRLYDSKTVQLVHMFEAPNFMTVDDLTVTSGHSRRIFALKFHPVECHIFLTGGWDNSVKIWDRRVARAARSVINGPHICGPAIDILDNKILTGSWVAHDALQLWDFRNCQLEKNINFPGNINHGEFLYAAQFCNHHTVIAGGSGTCSAAAINVTTDEVLGEISLTNKPVQTVDSIQDGQLIAVAGIGGNLHTATLC
ncbi:uncharacterized WD repeat-containing protein alr2800-like [Protopterus annectens]|uniref:uncharacterized WD repeat-containing protein alr2800-like n=1 Tax=Protopterus annectens TaxID=7888 RepID=UPI001CFA6416|nr:uncharacterized WD repeat-containing protein alr2800-like [Protopterus annectens]XP_043939448.1 uncharacterized WD repeat-containing protein alr2800-like [Protopterus annectens]